MRNANQILQTLLLCFAGLVLFGLAGCGESEAAAVAASARPQPPAVAPTPSAEQPDPLALVGQSPWVWHQSNITLIVSDPGAALEQARAAVIAAGGTIESASVGSNNRSASLRAGSTRESWPKVRTSLANVQGRIRSQSTSRSDRQREISRALARLELLRLADAELKQRLRQVSDEKRIDALTLQRELNTRERQSTFGRLRSYARELGNNRLYVSFIAAQR